MSTTLAPETPAGPVTPPWTPTGRAHLVDVHSFVFWVSAVATVFGGIHMFHDITSSDTVQANPSMAWEALVVWSLFVAVFAWILFAHQMFVRRAPAVVIGAFAWGALPAVYFAGHANAAFEDIMFHVFGADTEGAWSAAFSAPTNEELLKLTGVIALFLLPRARLRGAIDGLFYGAIVGLGFQVSEDFLYTIQNSGDLSGVIDFLFTRGFLTGLFSHAVFTAITGFGLGWCIGRKDQSWPARLGVAIGSFVVVWLFHMLWDSPLLNESFGDSVGAFFLVVFIKGLPLIAVLLIALRWARGVERTRWNEFVATYIDPTLLPPDDVEALQTRKSRRAARHQARHAGGRRAGKATELLQAAELRYVQSFEEEGPDSETATHWAGRIAALRPSAALVK